MRRHELWYLFVIALIVVLPPGKNDRPFRDNFVKWHPMNLVGGSNWSLGSCRLEEISMIASGQVLQIEKLICWQSSRVKMETSGQSFLMHVAIWRQNTPILNKYYAVKAIPLCIGVLTFLDEGSTTLIHAGCSHEYLQLYILVHEKWSVPETDESLNLSLEIWLLNWSTFQCQATF